MRRQRRRQRQQRHRHHHHDSDSCTRGHWKSKAAHFRHRARCKQCDQHGQTRSATHRRRLSRRRHQSRPDRFGGSATTAEKIWPQSKAAMRQTAEAAMATWCARRASSSADMLSAEASSMRAQLVSLRAAIAFAFATARADYEADCGARYQ